jgi:hypothetical protein
MVKPSMIVASNSRADSRCYSIEAHDATSCGTKSVIDATKLRIFDAALRAKGIGREGYENPNKAQTAKIKNIAARENKVDFDTLARGNKVSRETLEISTRKRGRKMSNVNCADIGGNILHMTMRSNGSSNIMGAATVPITALLNASFSP